MTRAKAAPRRRAYSPQWRDLVRPGVMASAEALVPMLIDWFAPLSVVDVGCGEGWFVRVFRGNGVQPAIGIDGDWVDGPDIHVDFSAPPYPELRFDLAISLEVAEHIAPKHADAFVAWLASLAPVVVFSAAIPGQGGPDHVNEQWPAYWVEKFARHGYAATGALRAPIWQDERIEPWYRQNLLAFASPDRIAALLHELGAPTVDDCLPLVHPGIWKVYR